MGDQRTCWGGDVYSMLYGGGQTKSSYEHLLNLNLNKMINLTAMKIWEKSWSCSGLKCPYILSYWTFAAGICNTFELG